MKKWMEKWWKKIMGGAVVVGIITALGILLVKFIDKNIIRYQAEEEVHIKELDALHLKEDERKAAIAKRIKELEEAEMKTIIDTWKARFES